MPNTDLVEIKVFDEQLAGKIQEDIKKFIENKTNEKNPFWTFSPQKQIEQSGKMLNMVNMVLSSIAAISLLVGGIGIMNIMLVTVTERKKEIGIRKALGASHAAIRNQFLVESAALTLTGGVAGTFAGLIISKIAVEYFFPSHFIFVPNIYGSAISFLFSGFIGIFFGLSPAIKASKLDPVAALTD